MSIYYIAKEWKNAQNKNHVDVNHAHILHLVPSWIRSEKYRVKVLKIIYVVHKKKNGKEIIAYDDRMI